MKFASCLFNNRSVYTVSYTHLDVYKRQQLEYVEQEICTKESDLKELRHKAKEIQKEIEEKQKDELFKACLLYTSRCV